MVGNSETTEEIIQYRLEYQKPPPLTALKRIIYIRIRVIKTIVVNYGSTHIPKFEF